MIVLNKAICDNLAQHGYRNVLKLPPKLIILEHLFLYLFVLKRKELKIFAVPQLFKKVKTFVLKVHIIDGIDLIRHVWNGKLIPCRYQNNFTLKILKKIFETLMIRIVLNWIKSCKMSLALILMD